MLPLKFPVRESCMLVFFERDPVQQIQIVTWLKPGSRTDTADKWKQVFRKLWVWLWPLPHGRSGIFPAVVILQQQYWHPKRKQKLSRSWEELLAASVVNLRGKIVLQIPAGERQQNYSTGRMQQTSQLKINPLKFYGEKQWNESKHLGSSNYVHHLSGRLLALGALNSG